MNDIIQVGFDEKILGDKKPKEQEQKIKIHYFYPIIEVAKKEKIFILKNILENLVKVPVGKRVITYEENNNIQLKYIKYDEMNNRWLLTFLKNGIDSPIKSKLNDNTMEAEILDIGEFVGYECCFIYDLETNIISIQSNRNSITFSSISKFLSSNNTNNQIKLVPIKYKEEYCSISDDEHIGYKKLEVSYIDISELDKLSKKQNSESIKLISKLSNNISALTSKIELGVGDKKDKFLSKSTLKEIVSFSLKNKKITRTLNLKFKDGNDITILDFLTNKVTGEIIIKISKDDPKTFIKILNQMNVDLDNAKNGVFKNCSILTTK